MCLNRNGRPWKVIDPTGEQWNFDSADEARRHIIHKEAELRRSGEAARIARLVKTFHEGIRSPAGVGKIPNDAIGGFLCLDPAEIAAGIAAVEKVLKSELTQDS